MTARTQQQRAEAANTPPVAGSLKPGQLYLELADPTKIWVGVPTGLDANRQKLLLDSTSVGTIRGVTAGNGLTGGGTAGTVTLGISAPVSIANGGTGAITAPLALAALGGAPLA